MQNTNVQLNSLNDRCCRESSRTVRSLVHTFHPTVLTETQKEYIYTFSRLPEDCCSIQQHET